MSLKQTVLTALETEQLKGLCAEFELEADRRSREAMIAALSGSKRAKPELLIVKLSAIQLRAVLNQFEQPTDGRKEELVQRLIAASGRALPEATTAKSSASDLAAEYRHRDLAVQRPEAGVQDHFQPKKSPSVYRYDSSLDPVLSWDEQRERDLGEWLLGLIVRAAKVGEAAVFAEPQVWKGGGVRVSIFVRCSSDAAADRQGLPQLGRQGRGHEIRVPTVPLFVHERHSTKAVLDGIRHRKPRGQTLDLFGDPGMDIRENLEAYEHKGPWQNRMILGRFACGDELTDGVRGAGRASADDLHRPAVRREVRLQLPALRAQARRQTRWRQGHDARARDGEGVSGHVGARTALISQLLAGPSNGRTRTAS